MAPKVTEGVLLNWNDTPSPPAAELPLKGEPRLGVRELPPQGGGESLPFPEGGESEKNALPEGSAFLNAVRIMVPISAVYFFSKKKPLTVTLAS